MKVIIAGGRDFRDFKKLEYEVDKILFPFYKEDVDIEIVSGGQVTIDPITKEKYGADYYGEIYAEEASLSIKRFLADWNKLGRAAGPVRNKIMAKYAATDGMLIAFWDGESSGTRNMIWEARKVKLKTHIIKY